MAQGRMNDPRAILAFMTAGKATVTFRSAESGARFTYKIKFAPKRSESDPDTWFVQLLNGPDNTADFCYIGILRTVNGALQYMWTAKARVGQDTPSVKAFQWALGNLVKDALPNSLEVYHEGRCGRCGRKLTVPESISSGFGPECINFVGFSAVSQIVAAGEATPQAKMDFGDRGAAIHGTTTPKISGYAATATMYAPTSSPTPVGAATTADGGSFLDHPVSRFASKVERVDNIDAEIRRRVEEFKREAPENYYQDGELEEKQAYSVAYNKFRVALQAGVQ